MKPTSCSNRARRASRSATRTSNCFSSPRMAWRGAANSVISEATRPQLEHVIGVQGINDRVILRVSTFQIAADRGTGRNPGATRFSSQTITARVTRLLVSGDFGRHALQNACPASSLPRLTPINHEADGGPCQKRPCVVPDVTATRWRWMARCALVSAHDLLRTGTWISLSRCRERSLRTTT